ncbi:MAG: glucose dehydrogenase [Phycisphaerae bacterium]|nr:glucose dehydrogenase [Phycisphaerae bacterium]|tara:strand:+ start:8012 stop:9562 length:1551 start_codon:yes stop_codon:yes gene_type:complete
MFTRALAGCVIGGLCLIAASQIELDERKSPGESMQIGIDAKPSGIPTREMGIQSERIVTGLSRPVYVGHAPDDESRLFIIEARSGSTGRIRIYDLENETLLSTPYLSISSVSTSSEQGLLGMAFHPDFYNGSPYIYVNYTDSGGDTIIRRYTATGNNPDSNTANSSSGTTLLDINQPYSNHNGGWLDFGTDGYLYIGMGDGGGAGDTSNSAQNLNSLLGKMLRIDVDSGSPYSIPAGNPFNDEIWSYGLRNPWGCSFDSLTGDLWMGDVGQYSWEEIDCELVGAEGGRNYGWRCWEGDHTFNTSGCPSASTMTFPVFEYSHSGGRCSITGGLVYRGQDIPWMEGYYIYGDYCTGDQYVFSYDPGSDNVSGFQEVTDELRSGINGGTVGSIARYGQDARGELYICDLGGEVYRIIANEPPAPTGACCWLESCYLVEESNCNNVGGDYNGDFSNCAGIDCTEIPCPADCDSSGSIGVNDLLAIIADWGTSGGCDPVDDGVTNVNDLLYIIGEWGNLCE